MKLPCEIKCKTSSLIILNPQVECQQFSVHQILSNAAHMQFISAVALTRDAFTLKMRQQFVFNASMDATVQKDIIEISLEIVFLRNIVQVGNKLTTV